MENMTVILLGDFETVSRSEGRRNNDIALSANYLEYATVAVQIDRPFRTHLLATLPANLDREFGGDRKSD